MALVPRRLLNLLKQRVSRRPITVLTGARQTGKTTLVRDLLPADHRGRSLYLNFDDPDERLRVGRDPVRLIGGEYGRVVIDEVQKLPAILDAVKLIADQQGTPQFVLLGSAQILLLRQIRETLAGRAALLELWPLSVGERVASSADGLWVLDGIVNNGEKTLRKVAAEPPAPQRGRDLRKLTEEGFEWGGYPALLKLPDDDERRSWLSDYRRTYLERDLADLGRVADLDRFALAQDLVALRTAQLLSYSELARDLGVAPNTVSRYVRYLEISYQVFLLRPWFRHAGKRLVKSPKVYWTDVGLVRRLGGGASVAEGALYETFLLSEILKWRSFQSDPPELYFFRTYAGAEVDFLLINKKTVIGIEAKSSYRVGGWDGRNLAAVLADSDARFPGTAKSRLGLVVYRGRHIEELRPHVWAIPDWMLFAPLDRSWAVRARATRNKKK